MSGKIYNKKRYISIHSHILNGGFYIIKKISAWINFIIILSKKKCRAKNLIYTNAHTHTLVEKRWRQGQQQKWCKLIKTMCSQLCCRRNHKIFAVWNPLWIPNIPFFRKIRFALFKHSKWAYQSMYGMVEAKNIKWSMKFKLILLLLFSLCFPKWWRRWQRWKWMLQMRVTHRWYF